MSIRHGLLALLERGPRYGSQLRTEFESRTGSTWPLNVGQVYTTLARLERDGLVAPDGEDAAGHTLYAITDAGRTELLQWYERPVDRANPPRDELSIKLAMAVGAPGVDIRAVIQSQRHATIKAMQDYTRLKATALAAVESGRSRERDDVAWLLVLEQLIFQTEAEARWLDHCEARLVRLSLPADRRAAEPEPPQAAAAETPAPPTTARPRRTARTRRG
ncbi:MULTISPECIES: PadR family transcriptional regulator [Streptomyces]|uniref:PadR family transcriptional regulator n=1 Tax=Streptomyces virginiae TaxID=1961 RepID=A0ABZ1TCI8_STRVG|nr:MULTISPECIES: PadR family transcriptional regulator [Streptomyces]MCX4959329.1 PadR family transcriptional regulator [Streptomyces virginiae]MCX5178144.1 PadR family transcriptional regulator [Streptomyces virginiae]WTB23655.1 PadR family transcriptional regulator [Streptomyces virginiae]